MKTNKENLSLSDLISEMQDVIHNNGRFCFSDTLYDVHEIVRRQENNNGFILYWGVRENGTVIRDCQEETKQWGSNCRCQGIYEIAFNNGSYSIRDIQ